MLRRVLNWFGTLVALAALGAVLFAVGNLYTGKYDVYVIHTGSMGNTIPPGSVVIVRSGEYHVGQVVSFRIANEVVSHRLLAIRSDGTITTKGDANPSADPEHPPKSNIIGGVAYAPRYLGYVLVFLRQPTGIACAILFILLFVQTPGLLRASEEDPPTARHRRTKATAT